MSATLNIGERKAARPEQRGLHPSAADDDALLSAHSALLSADSSSLRRRAWLTLCGLSIVFVVAALWRPPDEPEWVLCPFRALTHYPCPGCGMTRAFCALAHFEFWRAIKFNALSPFLFLAALVAWAWAASTVLRLERLRLFLTRLPRPTPAASKLMLALVFVWWVARLVVGF